MALYALKASFRWGMRRYSITLGTSNPVHVMISGPTRYLLLDPRFTLLGLYHSNSSVTVNPTDSRLSYVLI